MRTRKIIIVALYLALLVFSFFNKAQARSYSRKTHTHRRRADLRVNLQLLPWATARHCGHVGTP